MEIYYDAHNHLADPRLAIDLRQILEELKSSGLRKCVVNATAASKDWRAVDQLFVSSPDIVIPAYGQHPWHANKIAPSELREQLSQKLEQNSLAGIGECGLDRWIKDYDWQAQQTVFDIHLELAKNYHRPIYIHCLKAWGALIERLKYIQLPKKKFLVHAFSGSAEIAQELLKLGAIFSYSGYFLHERKVNIRNIYRELPLEHILIETDSPSMQLPLSQEAFTLQPDLYGHRNHPANIAIITESFLELRKETNANIISQLEENFINLTGI